MKYRFASFDKVLEDRIVHTSRFKHNSSCDVSSFVIYIYLNLIESKLKSRREDQDYLPVNKSGRLNFFSFYFSYAISILQLHSNEQREEGKVRQREKVIRDEQQNFCAEHRRG